jgi:hypothetical protein
MSQNKTIRVPASMILNSDVDNLTIVTYAFLSVTKCSEPLNSFTVFHFCQFINKNENGRIRSLLLQALNNLEVDGRIKIIKTSCGITYRATEHFFDDSKFAVLKISDINKILNSGSQGIFVLRLFAYTKLKMMNGLYFQSFASIGRLFNQEEKYIRQKYNLLQELNLIAHVRFTTSYTKRKEKRFIRFQIFSDMRYDDWEQRAIDYGDKLRRNKPNIANSSHGDELDLW